MKNIVSALVIPAVCLTLAADSTGRVSLKVTNKAGKPVPGAKVLLERLDIKWVKELTTNEKGSIMQVGLDPREFNFTITAEGYTQTKIKRKIPLGDTLNEAVVLLTAEESRAEMTKNPGQVVLDPSSAKEELGSTAFNNAVNFYNEGKFAEALPLLDQAYKNMKEASLTMKDATAKAELDAKLPSVERVYGIVLVETSKGSEDKAPMLKAEGLLTPAFEKNPKDARLATCLLEVAKAKQDPEMIKKYQAALDAITGPRPELAYNDAVTAFNAGNFKDAKVSVTKAIATDPKFADSYWLLGVVEFSLGSTKAAKEAFKKYMEIAPTGKKSGEVKEFLKELK